MVLFGALAAAAVVSAIPADAAASHHRHHHHKHSRKHSGRCKNADISVLHASTPVFRGAVLCLLNKARTARGLPPLRMSTRLNRSAQGWADTMVATSDFSHGNFASRVSAVGFNWSTLGENIASGFPTPREVVTAWLASPDHCMNMLDPIYSFVGTGVNKSPVSGVASRPGTWTQDFGLPMGAGAPSHNWGPADSCPH